MNEPTTIGSLNEALRRRYGVPGQSGPIITLASDLFPVVDLGDTTIDPSIAVYAGLKLCFGGAVDAADAALVSQVGIRNPLGSGVLAIVTDSHVGVGASGTINIVRFDTTPFDVETTGFTRDLRLSRGACLTGPRTAAPAATPLGVYRAGSSGIEMRTGFPLILPPGKGIRWEGGGVNNSLSATFAWVERRLESWELALAD